MTKREEFFERISRIEKALSTLLDRKDSPDKETFTIMKADLDSIKSKIDDRAFPVKKDDDGKEKDDRPDIERFFDS